MPDPATPTPMSLTGSSGGEVGDTAPEFSGITQWLSSDPLTMEGLRGQVVLIDFWTYTCINCIRTLPYLIEWNEKYADKGLTIVGVHAPEFEFEKVTENVIEASAELGVVWPVAQDNDFRTWRSYNNRFWPAKYLIDANGLVRYRHFGEGAYDETEEQIRNLLTEAGVDVAGVAANPDTGPAFDPRAQGTSRADQQTREIYGGWGSECVRVLHRGRALPRGRRRRDAGVPGSGRPREPVHLPQRPVDIRPRSDRPMRGRPRTTRTT